MSNEAGFRYKGVAGLGLSLMAGRVAQAVSFLLMARFLSAPSMGKVAIFTALFLGFFQLTNLGFDRYIVYARASDQAELHQTIDTVWTLQIVRGTLIMLATVPVYLLLGFFPQLGISLNEVIGIGAIVFVFSLANPELSSFEREGNFVFVSRARGLSVVAGALVMIVLVLVWRSPWVYLIGQMANALALVWLSYHYSTRRPWFHVDRERMGKVLDYSRHLILIAAVSFLATQAQHIYVGALFGAATLGMYFTWYRLVNLPGEFVTQMQDRLLFAKASEQSRRQQRNGLTQLVGFGLSMGLLIPFYVFVWFHGDVLMTLLAGARWTPFWWGGRMFVCISFLFAVAGTITPFNLVTVPHLSSRLRTAEALTGFSLILILGPRFGIAGVLAALLTEVSIAVLGRLYLLYRYIVTENRGVHLRTALLILAVMFGPLLAWEAVVGPLLDKRPLAFASLAFFLTWTLMLAACVYGARQRLRTRLLL